MIWLKRTVVVLLAFVAGVAVDGVGVALWIQATFECTPVPGDPCDGGPLLALGMFLVTAPVAGLLFAMAAMIWMMIAARRTPSHRIDNP